MHIIYIYTRYTETSAVASDPHNGETKTINTIQAKTLLRFVISRCMYFVIFSAIGPTCTFIILSVGIAGAGGGGGFGGSTPQLMSSTPLVVLLCLSWGVRK